MDEITQAEIDLLETQMAVIDKQAALQKLNAKRRIDSLKSGKITAIR